MTTRFIIDEEPNDFEEAFKLAKKNATNMETKSEELQKLENNLNKAFEQKNASLVIETQKNIDKLISKEKYSQKRTFQYNGSKFDFDLSNFERFINDLIDGYTEGKWYEHEKYLEYISLFFKNTEDYIIVVGQGEEPYDKWQKTFQNGKKISHKIAKYTFVETLV